MQKPPQYYKFKISKAQLTPYAGCHTHIYKRIYVSKFACRMRNRSREREAEGAVEGHILERAFIMGTS